MGPKGFLVVICVAVILFALLMVWVASSPHRPFTYKPKEGEGRLELVEGFQDPITVHIVEGSRGGSGILSPLFV